MNATVRLRSSVAILTGSALGSRAIGAVTSIISARALGAAGRGELALLLLAGLVGGVVLTAGLDLWVARSGASALQPSTVRALLRTHQVLAALAGSLVMGTVLLVADVELAPVAACALLAWATAASMIKLGVLQGANRMRAYAGANLAGSVAYGVLVIGLAVTGASSVTTFVLATAAGMLLTAAWRAPSPRDRKASSPLRPYGEALRFGVPGMLGGLVTHGLLRADVALVALWRSAEEAGLYSVALAVAEVLWILPNSAAQAIVPHASKPEPTVDTAQVSRVLVAAMVVGALAVISVGPLAVPALFGSEFTGAVEALPGLAAAAIAIGVWKLFSFHLLAVGDARTRLITGLVGLAVMVAADSWLVPRWGVAGASLGSLIAYCAAAFLCVIQWRRRSDASWRRILIMEGGDVRALVELRRSHPLPTGDDRHITQQGS